MSYLGRSAKLSLKAQEKVSFLATAGQTSKTGLSYVPNFVEVYVNGILLTDTTDFTATNGNSVTFTVALALNDEVTVVSLKTFTVADHYTQAQADAAFANKGVAQTFTETQSFNRVGSDGVIVDFEKDGATVGSVGIESGGLVIDGEAGHTGLRFANDSVLPRDNGVTTDGGDDLGSSTSRWRDAYLSGGVYLGGSGSSNKLDDYETGTWTPTAVVGSYTGTVVGKYTKVGRAVHITCAIQGVTDITTATGFNIGGLPFANASSDAVGSLMTRYVNPSTVAETGAVSFIGGGGSFVRMYFIAGTSSYHQVQHQHYTSSAVGIRIGITYFTT